VIHLAPNFVLREVVRSNTAERKGIRNIPTQQNLFYASALATLVGQPLRDHVNNSVSVTSWYRCPELNAAVGGSKTSAHMTGGAFDIRINGMTPAEIIQVIKKLSLPFDQVIDEGFTRNDKWISWVHIAIPKEFKQKPRGQHLTARGDRKNPTYEIV